MDKVVILARGLGKRMRKQDEVSHLDAAQAAAAETGIKALIPIGRPFLDYVLGSVAEAGYRRVCLVIGPEHDVIRDYCRKLNPQKITIDFAVQEKPLGTGDAVAAAEKFAGSDPFLVINSDNYYPVKAMAALRELSTSGLAAFTREGMLNGGNTPAEQLKKFSVIKIGPDGNMQRIIEKPTDEVLASMPKPQCLSLNCWRFGQSIFEACRNITFSPRGELEITDAVMYCIEKLNEKFRVLSFDLPVLDMSSRQDIQQVKDRLATVKIDI